MYPHQETIAEEKIDISKLPAKLQTKINKFNELEKKKFRTEEEEEELGDKDEAIFNDITEWLDEQDTSEEHEGEWSLGEIIPKKSKKESEPEPDPEPEEKLSTAPTATPKKKVEPTPATPPKEKVFNPVLGFAE